MFIRSTMEFINNELDDSKGFAELVKLEKFILSSGYKFSNYDLSVLLKSDKLNRILKSVDVDLIDFDSIGDICISFIEIYKNGGSIVVDSQKEIIMKAQSGDKKAKNKFIKDNQGLVFKIARMYSNMGIEFDDLVQEGNIGLMKALDRFDVNRGYRFSTYAVHWIKSAIRGYVFTSSKIITVPRHLEGKVNLYRSIREKFLNEYDREPSIQELARLMDCSIGDVDFIIHTQMSITSLDAPVGEDADTSLSDLIDSGVASPEDIYLQKELKPQIEFLLENSGLTEREKMVIKYKYGFYGNKMTLEEVGSIIGVTRERIRQIENKALRKLRKSVSVDRLIDFSTNPEESKEFIKNYKKYKY